MKKILFIVNPKSGVRRTKKIERVVAEELDQDQFKATITYTNYPHHGVTLARQAAQEGYAIVVAVGGDGSVNDVVQGLFQTNTTLAILPQGSGNGLARSLGIPLKMKEAVRLINRQHTLATDVGKVNDTLFVSNAGFGFDVMIADKFRTSKHRGFLNYGWLATKYLWTYQSREYKLMLDGNKIHTKAFILSIANAKEFGYGFQIAPCALTTDGLLEVTILKPFPKLFTLGIVFRAFTGRLLQSRFVKHYTARSISIMEPQIEQLQTDGDFQTCSSPIQIEVAPRSLKIIAPSPGL